MITFNYHRRLTTVVAAGNVTIGGDNPVRVQSMTNTDTLDIDASVAQALRMSAAGAELVRLTAQGVRHAEAIGEIRRRLREQGCDVPLVADIHFNPQAAFAAARLTDKVRINPGNFVDPARQFKSLSYTPEEYQAELDKIRETLIPFIDICREHGTAVRLGVNHGSLSDRIMSHYGNTPAGMVESVMEFLRVFVEQKFMQVVISMKASNVVVMVEAVRRLVAAMDAEDMHFPLHLGVTEAGFGEDGRIKSAVGIGTLLNEGLGDTVRVSLSEDPECEMPVARKLVEYVCRKAGHGPIDGTVCRGYNALCPAPRTPRRIAGIATPVVVAETVPDGDGLKPDLTAQDLAAFNREVIVVEPDNENITGSVLAQLHRLADDGETRPVIVKISYSDTDCEWLQVKAAADFGTIMMSHLADGIWLDAPNYPDRQEVVNIAFGILQAARLRTTHTEFISCPGCGRTLFDLQSTVKRVKAATAHLTHLKIGVMGCVVNGPGEMADADYGYVGAGPDRISLYKNKTCIEKNIPESEAITRLVELIKQNGDWKEP